MTQSDFDTLRVELLEAFKAALGSGCDAKHMTFLRLRQYLAEVCYRVPFEYKGQRCHITAVTSHDAEIHFFDGSGYMYVKLPELKVLGS